MNIKESIIFYLSAYDGEKQGAMKRVEEDFCSGRKKDYYRIKNSIDDAFFDLINKGNIELITCENMSDNQLWRFNTEGKTFYRIINRNID